MIKRRLNQLLVRYPVGINSMIRIRDLKDVMSDEFRIASGAAKREFDAAHPRYRVVLDRIVRQQAILELTGTNPSDAVHKACASLNHLWTTVAVVRGPTPCRAAERINGDGTIEETRVTLMPAGR